MILGAIQSFHNISSVNDKLILEDESGRVALGGAILATTGTLVTGR